MRGNELYNYFANISSYHFVIYTEVRSLVAKPVKQTTIQVRTLEWCLLLFSEGVSLLVLVSEFVSLFSVSFLLFLWRRRGTHRGAGQ